ncbi:hypothetical protein C3941_00170 [Kaistia algarum]|uniref:DNA-binding protein n=1 Tax=Kaistia algarum TaxID=2083279 RepID=UPI000CE73D54|nr:DNA-binding protein [Kaistia algarum]MCX5513368.1 DNA-binding protein [Kaistia algarum]PPE81183.1 hypothetical protein C3941_00170 [Kaistia algarum]
MTAPTILAEAVRELADAQRAEDAATDCRRRAFERVLQLALGQPENAVDTPAAWPPDPATVDLNERDAGGRKVWLTATEVGGLAKVDQSTVRKWAKHCEISVTIGGRVYFHRSRTMNRTGR